MAKIVRYTGDLKAFASAALGTERTIFGSVAQSDTIDGNIVADYLRGWGILGANDNPTKQDFQAIHYTLGQLLAYLHQVGVAEWDSAQEYNTGSVANTGGAIYASLVDANVGNDPAADAGANWAPLSVDVVPGIADMRLRTVEANRDLTLLYYALAGDGGHGQFRAVTGAALGTYVDNGGTIIVPTAGDGSSAWLRVYSGAVNPRWFGSIGYGVAADDTAAFTAMAAATPADVHITEGAYAINATVSFTEKVLIAIDQGATLTASGQGYDMFRMSKSYTVLGGSFVRAPIATNTAYCAFRLDFTITAAVADTQVRFRGCSIEGFDLPIFTDVQGALGVRTELHVDDCHLVINNLGTGGSASVRPTVYAHGVSRVTIKDSYLDASDTGSVNNIYLIGNADVSITNNKLRRGHAIKASTGAVQAMYRLHVGGNTFVDNTLILGCINDTNITEAIVFEGNVIDTPRTGVSDVGCLVFTTLAAIAAVSFISVKVRDNTFLNLPYSAYNINMQTGSTFGTIQLSGNHYYNTSTAAAGVHNVVAVGSLGTYGALIATSESVDGNASTKAYMPLGSGFAIEDAHVGQGGIVETGCTAPLTPYYDAGTFLPTVSGNTTAGVGTYTTQIGRFTRRGNRVDVEISLAWSAHTGTGSLISTSLLPADAATIDAGHFPVLFGIATGFAVTTALLVQVTHSPSSVLSLAQVDAATGTATSIPLPAAGGLYIRGSYEV